MFLACVYKRILKAMPNAIAVLDKKKRVRFINAAFRRQFPVGTKDKGSLAEVVGFTKEEGLLSLLSDCLESRSERVEDVFVTMPFGKEERELSLSIRAIPIGNKYCAVVVERVYEQELKRELAGAQAMQQRLLPVGKEIGGVPYRYMYIPCREIGGDLPDVYEVSYEGDRSLFGLIADVSGHGISAGMLSSFVKAGFDRGEPSPAKAVSGLSEKFKDLNPDEKSYITVAAVRLDKKDKTFTYCLAGHNAPILLKNEMGVSEIEMPAPPVSNWFDGYDYQDGKIPFEEGDVLVLLTDGVTETRNLAGEEFGIERVENILLSSKNANEFIDTLQQALKTFAFESSDDQTAIAFDL